MRYLLIAVLLSGCAVQPKDESAFMETRFGPTCTNLGLKKGTPDYANCLVKMYQVGMMR